MLRFGQVNNNNYIKTASERYKRHSNITFQWKIPYNGEICTNLIVFINFNDEKFTYLNIAESNSFIQSNTSIGDLIRCVLPPSSFVFFEKSENNSARLRFQ